HERSKALPPPDAVAVERRQPFCRSRDIEQQAPDGTDLAHRHRTSPHAAVAHDARGRPGSAGRRPASRTQKEKLKGGQLPCVSSSPAPQDSLALDRKSTRLNSSHGSISYAVFC